MKEYSIAKNDSGQRLNKFLEKAVPRLGGGQMHKYLRLKRIKVNGKRAEASLRLSEGDLVQLYLNDAYFSPVREDEAFRLISSPKLTVIYEDANILLADKAPGMVVHADESGDADTLIAHIQAYLVQTGAWDPADAASFSPALCNRIDRNTGGIVVAAKTAEALRILNEKIKEHELIKKYLLIVHGAPTPPSGQIENFLRRDEKRKQVTLHSARVPGSKTAITRYRTLAKNGGLSLVECELLTGRTHQIRAHMASIGCPLLGDGKYGSNEQNRPYREKGQALYAYSLTFRFGDGAGALSYLNGKTFRVKDIPFVRKYFPGFQLS
ncbi:RluA family pseudouridine synthase [Butyricicoccus faecihominis]|uniref:RluA family pseudouridine synthase n=1 Tax=Butyricicoccus faecihominis TaxID=1712515 RepID=UPI00247A2922|nr:RluA family pseudouridine synthase [Butyricicoccus faecihominis]MCQ5130169.1 RluA family pseudouridine synthase [Butyricicoccus faecihominis]